VVCARPRGLADHAMPDHFRDSALPGDSSPTLPLDSVLLRLQARGVHAVHLSVEAGHRAEAV
jgi:hypothetical protein